MSEFGMKGRYKKFDPALFKANDDRARGAVKAHLHGWNPVDNPDKYGPDLMCDNGYVEVEIKQAWRTGPGFPYDTVQLPERKRKFLKYNDIAFWILSKDCKYAIIIPAREVKDEYLKPVWNKYSRDGTELFFQVPVNNCEIVELTR